VRNGISSQSSQEAEQILNHFLSRLPIITLKEGSRARHIGRDILIPSDHRADVLAEVERFCRLKQVRVDHALFGTMSFADWMRRGYLHTDHHLGQLGH